MDAQLVARAREALRGRLHPTPLVRSATLSERLGREVLLKNETHQPTGSFKVRGALAALAALEGEAARRGVVVASAGNHALGVAWASRQLGVPALVVVPETVAIVKRRALEEMMVKLRVQGRDYDEAEQIARDIALEAEATFVSGYEDPWVIAGGGGTIALELCDERPDLSCVVASVGGGGLLGGLGVGLDARADGSGSAPQLVGVCAAASPAMKRSLQDGRVYRRWDAEPTLADGLAGGVAERTVALARVHARAILLADERAIACALEHAARREGLLIEGSAACALAPLLDERAAAELPGDAGPLAVVLSGRNIDRAKLRAAIASV
ncbi:MAG: pyridoxal-phosphate dependent enzyme [Myxococcales bacterium]|nr:pyridoxal-phosphate dependent enzyme [Myxococcales bacterium]